MANAIQEYNVEKRAAFIDSKAKNIPGTRCFFVTSDYVTEPGRIGGYWQERDVQPGESVDYRCVQKDPQGPWVLVDYMTSGDYTGSLVEESNRKVWLEEHDPDMKATVELYGDYSTKAIAVYVPWLTPEQVEVLEKLNGYPLIDESAYSDLEVERAEEDWESWALSDWRYELEKAFDVAIDRNPETDKALGELWHELCQDNDGWGDWVFSEGINTVYRFGKAIEVLDEERLLEISGVKKA